jgi:hypothetical protein
MPDIALPAILLLLKFALRTFLDREVSAADGAVAMIALPVDIVFFSASLLAAYIIIRPDHLVAGLGYLLACLLLAIFTIIIWRRNDRWFVQDKFVHTIIASLLNYAMSCTTLMFAVALLVAERP